MDHLTVDFHPLPLVLLPRLLRTLHLSLRREVVLEGQLGVHRLPHELVLHLPREGQQRSDDVGAEDQLEVLHFAPVPEVDAVGLEVGSAEVEHPRVGTALPVLHGVESGVVGGHHDDVPHGEGDDHEADHPGREAGDGPEQVDAGVELGEEAALGGEDGVDLEGAPPELQHPEAHVEAEEVERLLVGVADADLRPHAVVVQLVDALPAAAAVRHPRPLPPVLALLAGLVVVDGVGPGRALDPEDGGVGDYGLVVAPQAHEDVHPAQEAHYIRRLAVDERVEVLRLQVEAAEAGQHSVYYDDHIPLPRPVLIAVFVLAPSTPAALRLSLLALTSVSMLMMVVVVGLVVGLVGRGRLVRRGLGPWGLEVAVFDFDH